jgi:hypothetical protein
MSFEEKSSEVVSVEVTKPPDDAPKRLQPGGVPGARALALPDLGGKPA